MVGFAPPFSSDVFFAQVLTIEGTSRVGNMRFLNRFSPGKPGQIPGERMNGLTHRAQLNYKGQARDLFKFMSKLPKTSMDSIVSIISMI